MTESPQEMHGVPPEEDVQVADISERLAQDPDEVPNAPNRDPGAYPDEVPGPLEPGNDKIDLPEGTESFERPGRTGNWHPGPSDV